MSHACMCRGLSLYVMNVGMVILSSSPLVPDLIQPSHHHWTTFSWWHTLIDCDTMTSTPCSNMQNAMASLSQQHQQLVSQQQHQAALQQMQAVHQAEVSQLQAAHKAAVTAKDAEIANLHTNLKVRYRVTMLSSSSTLPDCTASSLDDKVSLCGHIETIVCLRPVSCKSHYKCA